MDEAKYNLIKPFKDVCNLFMRCGEYVGGAENLVAIYEKEFSTSVNSRCPGCFGAMLLDVGNKIKEYENKQSI